MKSIQTCRFKFGLFIVLIAFLAAPLSATAITLDQATNFSSNFGSGFGDLIDVWKVSEEGNDNSSIVASKAGVSGITELARNEDQWFSDGLVSVPLYPTLFGQNTGESSVGLWAYLGSATVDYLAVASAGYVALYGYDPSARYGGWTTADIAAVTERHLQGMSHITAYSIGVVPLPAAAPLFASALVLLGFIAYRRRKN